MLNVGSLIIEGLDYIFIVDKNYMIIYNTRYDANLNDNSSEYTAEDVYGKYYFDVYPNLKKEDSSIVKCLETKEIIINKKQVYYDYAGRRFVTNNVTFPLMRKGEIVAAVELSIDTCDENESLGCEAMDKIFDEFVLKLKKDTGNISFDTILTVNPQMLESIEQAKVLACLPNPTLVYGETGTGKELFVQSMITHSGVPKSKVVVQNCAAVPDNLIESILFGTVKGAYTGAENKKGLFEEADGGVLFLDELNSVPFHVQSKLLRVLQEGTFMPLGSTKEKKVNVKVIAAMNIDPIYAIENNIIRRDLFYRFSSGLITLPPLRERKEDIGLFINYYVDYFSRLYNRYTQGIDNEVRKLFIEYSWEGNVRELRNTIETMITVPRETNFLTKKEIPKYMLIRMEAELKEKNKRCNLDLDIPDLEYLNESTSIEYINILEQTEKRLIKKALEFAKGNKTKASEILGIPRQTLKYRMEKLNL